MKPQDTEGTEIGAQRGGKETTDEVADSVASHIQMRIAECQAVGGDAVGDPGFWGSEEDMRSARPTIPVAHSILFPAARSSQPEALPQLASATHLSEHLAAMTEELLDALKRGSETAWDDAFRQLYPCVFSAAQHPSAALTPSEAEDVAIETLTQLVPKVALVKRFDELKALGATMASRRAISVQRKKYAEKRGSNQTASLDQIKEATDGQFDAPAPDPGTLNPTDVAELTVLLDEVLGSLDEPTRKLIQDFILREVSYKELSARHKIPMGTVGVMLSRGLAKARDRMKESPRLMKELRLFLR